VDDKDGGQPESLIIRVQDHESLSSPPYSNNDINHNAFFYPTLPYNLFITLY